MMPLTDKCLSDITASSNIAKQPPSTDPPHECYLRLNKKQSYTAEKLSRQQSKAQKLTLVAEYTPLHFQSTAENIDNLNMEGHLSPKALEPSDEDQYQPTHNQDYTKQQSSINQLDDTYLKRLGAQFSPKKQTILQQCLQRNKGKPSTSAYSNYKQMCRSSTKSLLSNTLSETLSHSDRFKIADFTAQGQDNKVNIEKMVDDAMVILRRGLRAVSQNEEEGLITIRRVFQNYASNNRKEGQMEMNVYQFHQLLKAMEIVENHQDSLEFELELIQLFGKTSKVTFLKFCLILVKMAPMTMHQNLEILLRETFFKGQKKEINAQRSTQDSQKPQRSFVTEFKVDDLDRKTVDLSPISKVCSRIYQYHAGCRGYLDLHAFIKFSKNFHLVPAFMSERKAITIYLNVSKGETKVKKDVFPFVVYQCFKWKFEEEASDKQLCEVAKKYLESFSKKLNLA